MQPLTIVFVRTLFASLCFLLWFTAIGRIKHLISLCCRREFLPFFLIVTLLNTLHYVVQTVGLQFTTAANASLYVNGAPIAILLIAAIFLKERITLQKGIGVLIALIGVGTVMGWQNIFALELRRYLLGDLLVLSSTVMWGVLTVYSKKFTVRLTAMEISAVMTLFGTVMMLPFAWWEFGSITNFYFNPFPLEAWLAMAFLGVTCSFLAVALYIKALVWVESQKVGIYLYTIPPMTYLFAALYLRESIGVSLILGTVMVTAGVWLTQRS